MCVLPTSKLRVQILFPHGEQRTEVLVKKNRTTKKNESSYTKMLD